MKLCLFMAMTMVKVKGNQNLFCLPGSYLALYDDQQIYVEGLIQFFLAVNAGKF